MSLLYVFLLMPIVVIAYSLAFTSAIIVVVTAVVGLKIWGK